MPIDVTEPEEIASRYIQAITRRYRNYLREKFENFRLTGYMGQSAHAKLAAINETDPYEAAKSCIEMHKSFAVAEKPSLELVVGCMDWEISHGASLTGSSLKRNIGPITLSCFLGTVDIGIVQASLDMREGWLTASVMSPGKRHPHVSENGQICFGNVASLKLAALYSGDISGLLELTDMLLHTYSASNPYTFLEDCFTMRCAACALDCRPRSMVTCEECLSVVCNSACGRHCARCSSPFCYKCFDSRRYCRVCTKYA